MVTNLVVESTDPDKPRRRVIPVSQGPVGFNRRGNIGTLSLAQHRAKMAMALPGGNYNPKSLNRNGFNVNREIDMVEDL